MKTAIITTIDDNMIKNLEDDFLDTLRKTAKYKGEIYVIYYGNDRKNIKRLEKKYKIKIIQRIRELEIVNQRFGDYLNLFEDIPEITNVMLIDSGDVWFQAPIDEIFEITKDSYGFVEEDEKADKGFNLNSINQIKNKKLKYLFFKKAINSKLINGGLIVGNKEKLKYTIGETTKLIHSINQDFFGLDQAVLNYVIKKDGKGINLPQKYNYSLISKLNKFLVRKKIFYDEKNQMITIVHNTGSLNRILKNGRKDMKDIPKFPKKLPGTFWGITAFFNPAGYKNKYKNYKIFRESSKKQGLKLLAVELAFNDKPFELKKEDAEILIQLRTKTIFWQKERLLNIGIKNLPKDCDKFAWIDADIIFCNNNWIKETCKLLEYYTIIQPFDSLIRLSKGVFYLNPEETPFSSLIDIENFKSHGRISNIAQFGKQILSRNANFSGFAGLAWAARKEIFKKYLLFDKAQCSDGFMIPFFYNEKLNSEENNYINEKTKKNIYNWAKKINKNINESVYFTEGTVLHLWHGKTKDRYSFICDQILMKHDFNPDKDIKIDLNGCWVWNSNKPALHKEIKNYFLMRNEENSFLKVILLFVLDIRLLKEKILSNSDEFLGKIGIIIRNNYPEIYISLKRLKILIGIEKSL